MARVDRVLGNVTDSLEELGLWGDKGREIDDRPWPVPPSQTFSQTSAKRGRFV